MQFEQKLSKMLSSNDEELILLAGIIIEKKIEDIKSKDDWNIVRRYIHQIPKTIQQKRWGGFKGSTSMRKRLKVKAQSKYTEISQEKFVNSVKN